MHGPHVSDELPAYSLEILEDSEVQRVRAHLEECAQCQKELTAYRLVVDQLPLAAPEMQPAQRVKTRLFERIQKRPAARADQGERHFPRFFQSISRGWAVAFLVLLAASLITNLLLWRQVQALAAAPANQFHVVQLEGTDAGKQAYAWMVMTPDARYGTLIANGLPDLKEGQAYQLWLIRGEQRTSAGMFSVHWGYGAMEINAAQALDRYDRVGVTIEPSGGSLAPTGPRVLTGDL